MFKHIFRFLFLLMPFVGYTQDNPADSIKNVRIDSLINQNSKLQNRVDSLQKLLTPATPSKTPAFRYKFISDWSLTRGNVRRDLLIIRAELSFNKPKIELELNPRYAYGEQNLVIAERDFVQTILICLLQVLSSGKIPILQKGWIS